MIRVRRESEIFAVDGDWFRARWHFSFDHYRDPANMGWGLLRVFNDDTLAPGAVWPMHPHRDVEWVTYVVEGNFRHADSIGGGGVLPAGSVQRMTLGRGAQHSEQNASETEPMRFIQLWIWPRERGLEPSVEQRIFAAGDRTDRLLEAISPHGGDAALIHQDAWVLLGRLNPGIEVSRAIPAGSGAYLFVIDGEITLTGETPGTDKLATGDAAAIRDEGTVRIRANDLTELIVVQIPIGT